MSQHGRSKHGNYRRGRYEDKLENADNAEIEVDTTSVIIQAFFVFQKELDAKHDKYERLVKLSRDLSIESKRIIFLLHRIKKTEDKAKILEEAEKRLKDVQRNQIKRIVEELLNVDLYHYLRAFTAGIQEFIEALTFYYYEKDNELVSLTTVIKELELNVLGTEGEPSAMMLKQTRSVVQPSDYVLGIADLTGELMRKCITAIGAGQLEMPFNLCSFLRQMHDGFLSIGNQGPREITRKMTTLKQSLNKVETACYTLQVRGSEIPKHMLVDVFTGDEFNNQRQFRDQRQFQDETLDE